MQTLQFPSLQGIPDLRHAITTRHGGSSTHSYASLNLGFHVGDEPQRVQENRRLVASALNYNVAHSVAAQQTHSANIRVVTQAERGRGALAWDTALPDTDALITREIETSLVILVADCAPLLLVDPTNRVLATVHAGWRGAVAHIASQTVERMMEMGSRAQDIQVGIGPHLCASCFEVGEEVAQAAAEVAPQSVERNQTKPHLNLSELLCEDLRSVRVLGSQIENLPRCPRCETETFFSHRGESGITGRFGLVAWWS